jgi:hypothetical protein
MFTPLVSPGASSFSATRQPELQAAADQAAADAEARTSFSGACDDADTSGAERSTGDAGLDAGAGEPHVAAEPSQADSQRPPSDALASAEEPGGGCRPLSCDWADFTKAPPPVSAAAALLPSGGVTDGGAPQPPLQEQPSDHVGGGFGATPYSLLPESSAMLAGVQTARVSAAGGSGPLLPPVAAGYAHSGSFSSVRPPFASGWSQLRCDSMGFSDGGSLASSMWRCTDPLEGEVELSPRVSTGTARTEGEPSGGPFEPLVLGGRVGQLRGAPQQGSRLAMTSLGGAPPAESIAEEVEAVAREGGEGEADVEEGAAAAGGAYCPSRHASSGSSAGGGVTATREASDASAVTPGWASPTASAAPSEVVAARHSSDGEAGLEGEASEARPRAPGPGAADEASSATDVPERSEAGSPSPYRSARALSPLVAHIMNAYMRSEKHTALQEQRDLEERLQQAAGDLDQLPGSEEAANSRVGQVDGGEPAAASGVPSPRDGRVHLVSAFASSHVPPELLGALPPQPPAEEGSPSVGSVRAAAAEPTEQDAVQAVPTEPSAPMEASARAPVLPIPPPPLPQLPLAHTLGARAGDGAPADGVSSEAATLGASLLTSSLLGVSGVPMSSCSLVATAPAALGAQLVSAAASGMESQAPPAPTWTAEFDEAAVGLSSLSASPVLAGVSEAAAMCDRGLAESGAGESVG